MQINQYSFLRWDDGAGPSPTDLPQAYIRDRCQFSYMPIIVPGENIAFYINTQYGYDYGAAPTLQIVKYGVVVWTGSPLQKDQISVSNYNLYADFAIPALSNGVYQFRVRNNGGATVLTSNDVYCMNSDYNNISSYLEFTNPINLYNVRYSELTNFYQKIRLRITDVTGGDYEDNNESYLSVTTGRHRDLLSIPQKSITFECYYFDKEALEATAVFLAHQTRIINEKVYSFKTGLSHDPITVSKVAKGTFQMYDQSFSTVNKCSEYIPS